MHRKRTPFHFMRGLTAAILLLLSGLLFFTQAQIPDRIYTDSVPAVAGTALPVDLAIKEDETGAARTVEAKILGIFPAKTVRIASLPVKEVIPGGDAVAVRLSSKGVAIVGFTDDSITNPARKAGLKAGDSILRINDTEITSADTLTAALNTVGAEPIRITYLRGDGKKENTVLLTPTSDGDGNRTLGVLIRDSAAGIGTVTYFVPETGQYGSLGHGINDPDTDFLFRVGRGDLYPATITSVRKGLKGAPGELQGSFGSPLWGSVDDNRVTGLFGTVRKEVTAQRDTVPVAAKEEVREGDAVIRCTLDGGGIREYSVQIERIYRTLSGTTKNLLIKVTDPKLLEQTGGIVQGMSGSPILQNGKIVGAVTHVLINDPTRGYGIFIENMLCSGEEGS